MLIISILILGKVPMQGLDDTTLTAEKEYYINFTEQHKKFCLGLCYNGVNGVKIFKFKAKNSEINAARLCLGKVFFQLII